MMPRARLFNTAIILLTIGILGLISLRLMADQNNMSMMNWNGWMMGKNMPPGINPADLPKPNSEGAQLVGKYCSQCHGVPGPGLHIKSEWPDVIARMNQRMQMMSGGGMMMRIDAPIDNEIKVITAYLEDNAQQSIDKNQFAGDDTAPGKAFKQVCAQCHALPDPSQHTASEWPDVVERMRTNISVMGKPLPDEVTTEQIVNFLQKYSK